MKPKEKAIELSQKYLLINKNVSKHWKECALIAVAEILLTLNKDIKDLDVVGNVLLDLIDYWNEVEQEIINL